MQENTCYQEWGFWFPLILLNNQILVSMICFWLAKPKSFEENQVYVSLPEGSERATVTARQRNTT